MNLIRARFSQMIFAVAATLSLGACDQGIATNEISVATPIRIDGVGPIRIGMTVAEAEKTAHTSIPFHAREGETCEIVGLASGSSELAFLTTRGVIARVEVYKGTMATEEGAHLGSTEAEIVRLYAKDHVETTPHPYDPGGHYIKVTKPGAGFAGLSYIFETDGHKVTSFRSGRSPEVD